MLGTLAYMSPEQVLGEDVDHRSDLWSFGVVLYEMLARELPFRRDREAAVLYEILNQEPTPVETHRPDVPPTLRTHDPAAAAEGSGEATGVGHRGHRALRGSTAAARAARCPRSRSPCSTSRT